MTGIRFKTLRTRRLFALSMGSLALLMFVRISFSDAKYALPINAPLDAERNFAHYRGMGQSIRNVIEKKKDKNFRRGEKIILRRGSFVSEVTFLEKLKSGRAKIINKHGLIDSVMLFEIERKDDSGNVAG